MIYWFNKCLIIKFKNMKIINSLKKTFGKGFSLNCVKKVQEDSINDPKAEQFYILMNELKYKEVHQMLANGFNVNQNLMIKESLFDDYGLGNLYILIPCKFLDLTKDKPMQKLLRAYGATSTSEDVEKKLAAAKERETDVLQSEKEHFAIVEQLLSGK